jgi:hypothetical protein
METRRQYHGERARIVKICVNSQFTTVIITNIYSVNEEIEISLFCEHESSGLLNIKLVK